MSNKPSPKLSGLKQLFIISYDSVGWLMVMFHVMEHKYYKNGGIIHVVAWGWAEKYKVASLAFVGSQCWLSIGGQIYTQCVLSLYGRSSSISSRASLHVLSLQQGSLNFLIAWWRGSIKAASEGLGLELAVISQSIFNIRGNKLREE